jgi:hypothetical protein
MVYKPVLLRNGEREGDDRELPAPSQAPKRHFDACC